MRCGGKTDLARFGAVAFPGWPGRAGVAFPGSESCAGRQQNQGVDNPPARAITGMATRSSRPLRPGCTRRGMRGRWFSP